MKHFFLFIFLFGIFNSINAQWLNTTNSFDDNFHVPVCTSTLDQRNSIVVKSYPDSGYFIIWEDVRTDFKGDLYAQKFDKNGVAQWATNGVPVATGPERQSYTQTSITQEDYRAYSFAATDSAGGFFCTWVNYNENSGVTNRKKVCIQHITNNGSQTLTSTGYQLTSLLVTDDMSGPQLVADGMKGCFVAYTIVTNGSPAGPVGGKHLIISTITETSPGVISQVDRMIDENKLQVNIYDPCAGAIINPQINYIDEAVDQFYLFENKQKGCNIVWVSKYNALGTDFDRWSNIQKVRYNSLIRVKKDCSVSRIVSATGPGAISYLSVENYTKNQLTLLRKWGARTDDNAPCVINNIITIPIVSVQAKQFAPTIFPPSAGPDPSNAPPFVEGDFQEVTMPRGVIVKTGTNMNINVIAYNRRLYRQATNTFSKWYTMAIPVEDENYDSIPWQLATNLTDVNLWTNAINTVRPDNLKAVKKVRLSVLDSSSYFYTFSLAATNNRVYFAAAMQEITPNSAIQIKMQELKVTNPAIDTFALVCNTENKSGVVVGKNLSTNFSGTNIIFTNPQVVTNDNGNALFFISEEGRFVRASPIKDSARLAWGATGKPIGNFFRALSPTGLLNNNGSALITWCDDRANSQDVYMRNLDNLNVNTYYPYNVIKPFAFSPVNAFPQVISGQSKSYTEFFGNQQNFVNGANVTTTSPVLSILDDYNLGAVKVQINDHNGAVRVVNGKSYLSRNYKIDPDNNPNGTANIRVRLNFTTAQFDALKLSDPSIITPANLIVVKQPSNANINVTTNYAPVAGEVEVTPIAWQAINGGYFVEIEVNSFSEFYLRKSDAVLAVTWVNIFAERLNDIDVNVQWKIANEINVKDYTVQISNNGIDFKNACTTIASNTTNYNCVITAAKSVKQYVRIMQADKDGKISYSKTIVLQPYQANNSIVIYPNPAADYTTVTFNKKAKERNVTLINVSGIAVWNKVLINDNNTTIEIPLQKLVAGIYWLKITDETGVITKRIIKK
jgi:Secretion system C-terminal sorting domain